MSRSPERITKQIKNVKITNTKIDKTSTGTIYKALQIKDNATEKNISLLVKIFAKENIKKESDLLNYIQNENFIIENFSKKENLLNFQSSFESINYYYLIVGYSGSEQLPPTLRDHVLKNKMIKYKTAQILTFFMQILNGYTEFFNLDTIHLNLTPRSILMENEKNLILMPFFKPFSKFLPLKKKLFKINACMSPELLNLILNCQETRNSEIFETNKKEERNNENIQSNEKDEQNKEFSQKNKGSSIFKTPDKKKPKTNLKKKKSDDFESILKKTNEASKTSELVLDYKSDIWSMGIILFFLIFKEYPFIGETGEELKLNISMRTGNVIKEFKNKKNVEYDLLELIQHLIEFDPKKRIGIFQILKEKVFERMKDEGEKDIRSNWCKYFTKIKVNTKEEEKTLARYKKRIEDNDDLLLQRDFLKLFEEVDEFSNMCRFLILFDSLKKKIDSIEDIKGKQCLTPRSLRTKLRSGEIRVMKYDGSSSKKHSEEVSREESEINISNFALTEEEALERSVQKYYNELDWHRFLFSFFQELEKFEKEIIPSCVLARYALIKYIYYRNMNFENKITEDKDIYYLERYWEKIVKTKEYKNIKLMLLKEFKLDGQNVWSLTYFNNKKKTNEYLDSLKFNPKCKRSTDNIKEKTFISDEQPLNVLLFNHLEFQTVFRNLLIEFLYDIEKKIKLSINSLANFEKKLYYLGLVVMKVIKFTDILGLKRFEIKEEFDISKLRDFFGKFHSDYMKAGKYYEEEIIQFIDDT